MRRFRRLYKKAVPTLALFALVVLALVASRAWTIIHPPRDMNGNVIEIPSVNYLTAFWLELKNILKWSRYM